MTQPINPAIFEWNGVLGLPEFERIDSEDLEPAFAVALEEDRAEIDAIANDAAEPTFSNTIEALELTGEKLGRVSALFWNLVGADSDEVLRAAQSRLAPVLSRHGSETAMNADLFKRVDALWQGRDALELNSEQLRLLERRWKSFVRAGAALDAEAQAELADLSARLAELGARFSQNLLADEAAWFMEVDDEEVLAAMPADVRSAMEEAALARNRGGHIVTTSRSVITPFLTFCPSRELRREAFEAWTSRGERGGDTDNREIVAEILKLRQRRAELLGYRNFAAFKLEDQMAGRPADATKLLENVWAHALERAKTEEKELEAKAAEAGANHRIAPFDWAFYAEQVRSEKFDFDADELKPYLTLDNMLAAAFDVANRLFGLQFREDRDTPRYHRDLRVFEVSNADGSRRAVFLGDYFARPSKRSGAWMSAFQTQRRLGGARSPIIVNVCNFAKSSRGDTLLSLDDARTLFHEFGHALHGMLSDVTYPSLAGTAVARDFVELPSQLYEHWLTVPEVLAEHARHVRTGEPMPRELLDKVLAGRTFNAGFDAVEFTASALVDMAYHTAPTPPDDPMAFEKETLRHLGLPSSITMRHRTPHFAHVFSGDGYSAGYYSYMWSEVLDADAFAAFEEAGDPFDPRLARRLREHIYAAGGSIAPDEAYEAFRGRLPTPDAMLEKRGLRDAA